MGTIANAKVTHYYNCYNGDFIGCLLLTVLFLLFQLAASTFAQEKFIYSSINFKFITWNVYQEMLSAQLSCY